MLNKALLPRLRKAGVDREVRGWEKTSDHAPVWIELADEAKPPAPARRNAKARTASSTLSANLTECYAPPCRNGLDMVCSEACRS